jgi:hypothetical protein
MPAGVSASAVAEACLMADEDLTGAQVMAVRAARRGGG